MPTEERAWLDREHVEPFKITCVTCQAGLSVRNASLIGQIVACPRCNSMVQVERPAGADVVPAPTAASAPVQPASLLQPVAESVAPVSAPPSINAEITQGDNIAPPQGDNPVPPEIPPVRTTFAKYKLLSWTLGAFVAGAAVTGLVLFLQDGSKESTSLGTTGDQQQEELEKSSTVPESIGSSPVGEVAAIEEITTKSDERITNIAVEESVSEVEAAEPTTVVVEPAADTEPIPDLDVPKVARRFDPLEFDPESLDLSVINNTGVKPATESDVTEPQAVESVQSNEVAAPLQSTLPNVRRDPNQTVTPAVAKEKLRQKFPALKVQKMPLGDFLTLVSRLSGVPLSVAPEELQMAGITARKTVSLDAKDIDLNQALQSVLKPLHLEAVAEGPLVRVVRKGGSKLREVSYPLDDLSSVASAGDIANWVEQLVAPAEWQSVGGRGTLELTSSSLKINQVQWVQYQVLIFLERLRLVNQLPLRSRFPIKKFGRSSAHAGLASRLKAPAVFTFSRYTALQEVIRHWQEEIGAPILVDWFSLAEVDLWPQTRVACSIENRPWQTAFDDVLEPLGLGWRAVAGEMLEICSSQKMQTQPQLELYLLSKPLKDGSDSMLAELASLVDDSGIERTAISYDSGSHLLFVLQPAEVQRKVYDWLVNEHLIVSD